MRELATVEDKIVEIAQMQLRSKSVRRKRISVEPKSPTRALIEGLEVDKEEDGERAITRIEAPFLKPRKTVKKRKEILNKVCAVEVCKPEICCADLEGKLPFPTTAQTSFRRVGVRRSIFSLSMRRRLRRRGRTG